MMGNMFGMVWAAKWKARFIYLTWKWCSTWTVSDHRIGRRFSFVRVHQQTLKGGTLLFSVQWLCYSDWVAGCNMAFYITSMLKHHWSQLKKKPVWTMKFNNNWLHLKKSPADLVESNALALVALSCFCRTLAHTMKSLVKKREIVFAL